MHIVVLALGAAAATAAMPPTKEGEPFPVPAPTTLFLADGQKSTSVLLHNEASKAESLAVSIQAWSQDVDGEIKLSPTRDLRLPKATMRIAAGATARLVLMVAHKPVDAGRHYYRLLLRQMPKAGISSGVYATVSLPIFVGTPSKPADLRIDRFDIRDGVANIVIHNYGGDYIRPSQITVVGVGEDGGDSFKVQKPGWYILSGNRRNYAVGLSRSDCQASQRFTLKVEGGPNPPLLAQIGKMTNCGDRNTPTAFSP